MHRHSQSKYQRSTSGTGFKRGRYQETTALTTTRRPTNSTLVATLYSRMVFFGPSFQESQVSKPMAQTQITSHSRNTFSKMHHSTRLCHWRQVEKNQTYGEPKRRMNDSQFLGNCGVWMLCRGDTYSIMNCKERDKAHWVANLDSPWDERPRMGWTSSVLFLARLSQVLHLRQTPFTVQILPYTIRYCTEEAVQTTINLTGPKAIKKGSGRNADSSPICPRGVGTTTMKCIFRSGDNNGL